MDSLEALLAYIPSDRRTALAAGRELPHQTSGAALCADLSGFTPLTEAMSCRFGPRRGAEELALYLNRFYDALIAPVGAYRGSVVAFSGDAITCWFDSDDGARAIAAAQAMQLAMQPFLSLPLGNRENISLGVKIAIVSGPARRFQVGDPTIQFFDTLAGASMDRLSVLGHLARTGEILLDEPTAIALPIAEWRTDPLTGCRAAVLKLPVVVRPPEPSKESPTLTQEQIRPWLLPAVFARLQGGQGEFLTELRPAVALFMRFDGLNYDDDQAGAKLDVVIRTVQRVLLKYDGSLLQLTIGDKGSYLYAAFGAPVAHEDDTTRAVHAALALRALPMLASVSVGLSRGVMRTGAYGSATRRTYGVLGDEANLAARLMECAAPGQVLASESIWQDSAGFRWQKLPAFQAKGKQAAITPAALLGRVETDALTARANLSALPMIGRRDELLRVEEKLALARQGHGQIVSLVAEAGMGKSRLLAEVLQHTAGLACYSGECQSYDTNSAYLVWHAIWRALFDGTHIHPDHLPLLAPALNLSIPDNSLTAGMDARSCKVLREALLLDCLRERAAQRPLILVLEDVHWIDPLSADLLEGIGRAIETLPVLILLAHRPADAVAGDFLLGLTGLPYFTHIPLNELSAAEIGQLLAVRLSDEMPPALLERLSARVQGNPFYAEELLNYLHDCGLDPRQESAWEQADLPDSLHSLILSRIDQLSERQQITIKAASVIGRLFRTLWLAEYYPALGGAAQVALDLERLSHVALITPETPAPHLAYLFKHVITQEVAYESLAYATRANLHEQFAAYLEQLADAGPFLDLLAFHYERSDNLPKKREYLRKAGEAAQNVFANAAALTYLSKALALAPEADAAERFDLLFVRKQVYDLLGENEAHQQDMLQLLALSENLDDTRQAQAALSRSKYAGETKDYPTALVAAQQAVAFARHAGAHEYGVRGYLQWANALQNQMNYVEARVRYGQALSLTQSAGLTNWLAAILLGFGGLSLAEANFERAQFYLERALQVQGEGAGHRLNQAAALYTLGQVAYIQRDFSMAQAYYQQAVDAFRKMGKPHFEAIALDRIGYVIAEQAGDEQSGWSLKETGERFDLISFDFTWE